MQERPAAPAASDPAVSCASANRRSKYAPSATMASLDRRRRVTVMDSREDLTALNARLAAAYSALELAKPAPK